MPSNILRITERVVGFIVLVICILLIFQNKELKKRLELGGISGKSIYEPLERGNNVPPADCFEIDGTRSTLKYTDGYEKYLLFVFSWDSTYTGIITHRKRQNFFIGIHIFLRY